MKSALAVFVKTPGLTPLKTRLAKTIGTEKAEEFYEVSLNALKETILKADKIKPHFAVAETEGLTHKLWNPFGTFRSSGSNLGEVLHNAYAHLMKEHDAVLFLGSDSPQITTEMLNQSLAQLKENDFVFGPAVDGGFYLFAGKTSIPKEDWVNVKYSANTTLNELCGKLKKHGSIAFLEERLSDVDEECHLKDIVNEMPSVKTTSQQQVVNWVKTFTPR